MTTVRINFVQPTCGKSIWENKYSVHLEGYIEKKKFKQYISELNYEDKETRGASRCIWVILVLSLLVSGIGAFLASVGCYICFGIIPLGFIFFMVLLWVVVCKVNSKWRRLTQNKIEEINDRTKPCNWVLRGSSLTGFFIDLEIPSKNPNSASTTADYYQYGASAV